MNRIISMTAAGIFAVTAAGLFAARATADRAADEDSSPTATVRAPSEIPEPSARTGCDGLSANSVERSDCRHELVSGVSDR